MTFFASLPQEAKIYDVFAHRPELFEPFVTMVDRVSRGESQLSRAERELIGAYVSALNDCPFCVQVHGSTATELGMDRDLVNALLTDPDQAEVDPALRPLLAFARKITHTPYRIVAGDIEAARAAGWEEQAIQDVIVIVCIANFMNRFVSAHGLEGEGDYFAAASRRIREEGFRMPE